MEGFKVGVRKEVWEGNKKRAPIRESGRRKYRRKGEEGKITLRISEKITGNYNTNDLLKIKMISVSLYKNIHKKLNEIFVLCLLQEPKTM